MRKYIIIIVVMLFLCCQAYADKAIYILANPAFPDNVLVTELGNAGFTVDLVDNDDIGNVDWGQYDFMMVQDQSFSNWQDIPVNNFPALILNTRYMDEWHWTSRISLKSSSMPLYAWVNNDSHFMTAGFPESFPAYTSSSASYNYLHRYYRASQLKPIAATSNSSAWEMLNGVVLTASAGTRLKDGFYSNTSTVFFGIDNTQYWTSTTKQLFRNAAQWLATDFIPPKFSNVGATSKTNSSMVIEWDTDKLSNTQLDIDGRAFSESTPKLHHIQTVDGLLEDTEYNFTVSGCNQDSFCGTSIEYKEMTEDYTAPDITSFTIASVTNESATINAAWNENGQGRALYGTGSSTPMSISGTQATFHLTGLIERTIYPVRIELCDDSGNCMNSSIKIFTTEDYTAPAKPKGISMTVEEDGTTVRISWDAPMDDAQQWNIYSSPDNHSFDFGTPLGSTGSLSYSDTTAGPILYYVIRAEDGNGNEEENHEVYMKYDIDLKTGYNLVSLPVNPLSEDINEIMHQTQNYHPVSEIRRWNASAQEFESTIFATGMWSPVSFQELKYGAGYFWYSEDDTAFTLVGTEPHGAVLHMEKGMNLVGMGGLSQRTIDKIYSDGEVARRTATGDYQVAAENGGSWHNQFSLEPGKGYWAYAGSEYDLNLN